MSKSSLFLIICVIGSALVSQIEARRRVRVIGINELKSPGNKTLEKSFWYNVPYGTHSVYLQKWVVSRGFGFPVPGEVTLHWTRGSSRARVDAVVYASITGYNHMRWKVLIFK